MWSGQVWCWHSMKLVVFTGGHCDLSTNVGVLLATLSLPDHTGPNFRCQGCFSLAQGSLFMIFYVSSALLWTRGVLLLTPPLTCVTLDMSDSPPETPFPTQMLGWGGLLCVSPICHEVNIPSDKRKLFESKMLVGEKCTLFLLKGHHPQASNCAVEFHLFAYLLSATYCLVRLLMMVLGRADWRRKSREV